MGLAKAIVGTVATIVIGGTAYTVSQKDVASNFANDTGVSQQQAENYVNNVKKEDLVPYNKIGEGLVSDGNGINTYVLKIDCANYTYDWESPTLTCTTGKSQLTQFGIDEIALGKSYIKLSSDTANKSDMTQTIALIDRVNNDYGFEIISKILEPSAIQETKNSNSYNKATLKAAVDHN